MKTHELDCLAERTILDNCRRSNPQCKESRSFRIQLEAKVYESVVIQKESRLQFFVSD